MIVRSRRSVITTISLAVRDRLPAGHWSSASSDTDLTYTWENGKWVITGGAATTEGVGYEWEDKASKTHATGTISGSRSSSHNELATLYWVYDTNTGTLNLTSVENSSNLDTLPRRFARQVPIKLVQQLLLIRTRKRSRKETIQAFRA